MTLKQQMQKYRFLLCDTTDNAGKISLSDEEYVNSPIQCLSKAFEEAPEIIVIRFGDIPIREREALLELIAALKRNRHTNRCNILALIHSKNRMLIEHLSRLGVEFVRYTSGIRFDSFQIQEIINSLGPDDATNRHLAILCPFLHYSRIDSKHEMTVCGAYFDRLVLGGRQLHEICETNSHLNCEYYLHQRCSS